MPGNNLIGFEGSPGASQALKGSYCVERVFEESIRPIMLRKQAPHFAANDQIPTAGLRNELGSPLGRLFQSGVKYFFDLFQSSRGHFGLFSPEEFALWDT